jgi:signal transduction histidine kinase
MRNTEGAAVLVGGIAEDITARKERDEARDALHHRLESLVAERTAALQDANLELEAFTRTAAHDLKTPLNAIVGLCGLLRGAAAQPLTDAQQRHLMLIERSSRDMATLINDLLALSRAGHVEVRREVVDLAPMVREQIETLRLEQPLRHCEWIVPPHLPVHGDAGLLRSALHNLIGNAWKFTGLRERARIECAIEHEGSDTTLVVRDNGAGFDASGLDERLRPFQRFHTQAQFQGHGLGLVTCQRIAHRHGGRLVIDSVPGQGTVVRLTLPSALAAPPDVPPQETLTPARDCAASPA